MPRSKRPFPNSQANIKARLQEVREMHRIGTALQKLFPKRAPARKMAQQAAKLGIPKGEGRRYRQFATMYSKPELQDLYKQCRNKKFALTTTHFRVLIGVQDKLLRSTLANRAIKKTLSVSALRRLTPRKKKPKTPSGGRKPDILKLLETGNKKFFRKRLQLVMAKLLGLLKHLLEANENGEPDKKIDLGIANSLKELQASVENVGRACKVIRSK